MELAPYIFETNRLLVRHLNDSDIPKLAKILGDPEVMRYSVRGVMTEEETQEFVDWCKMLYSNNGFGPWAIQSKNTSELLGFAGLSPKIEGAVEIIEIGYRLRRDSWGQGFATEATLGILDYAFRVLGLDQIAIIILPEHVASLNVARKVGFSTYDLIHCDDMEVRKYLITKEEWYRNNT